MKGYDVVAYQTQSRPVKGSPKFVHQWGGATWWFADESNRSALAADPQKYAPQFGGYCSWAVSKGYTADVDPDAWRVIAGRLYLNYDKSVQRKWEPDVSTRIAEANRNCPTLHK